MSGDQRRPEAPKGPPWSLDVLADYHAGVLDDDVAQEVQLSIESDDEAQETLAALTATTNDLAALPPVPIPADIAAQVESALAEQARERANAWAATRSDGPTPQPHAVGAEAGVPAQTSEHSNVVDIRTRRRRASWGALLVASAAVIGAVVAAPLIMQQSSHEDTQAESPKPPQHEGPPSTSPLALSGDAAGDVTLTRQQFGDALQSEQYAESLRQPEQLFACLEANGIDNGRPLGAREVTVDGQPAQLFILSGGEVGQFRLLTVGPHCGANNPETISDSTFGG